MAGDEHQAKQVVLHTLVGDDRLEVGLVPEDGAFLPLAEFVTELLELAGETLVPADQVDGLVPGRGAEPRRTVGQDRLGPLLERRDECVLREFLGRPTSFTSRARPAMILADSSRQTASTARCTSGTVINRIRASPAAAPQSGAAGYSGP